LELIDTVTITGCRYYNGESVEHTLRRGNNLVLVRDPHNEYDANAVEVLLPSGKKLDFVPEKRNAVPASLLDHGTEVTAKVREVRPEEGPWERVRIDIFAPALGALQAQRS
jgi:hypothetical protein